MKAPGSSSGRWIVSPCRTANAATDAPGRRRTITSSAPTDAVAASPERWTRGRPSSATVKTHPGTARFRPPSAEPPVEMIQALDRHAETIERQNGRVDGRGAPGPIPLPAARTGADRRGELPHAPESPGAAIE